MPQRVMLLWRVVPAREGRGRVRDMLPKQTSIPPLFIALVVWGIGMGVDAGGWTLHPLLSWGLFIALLIAVFWFAIVWIYNSMEWLGKHISIPNWARWFFVIVFSSVFPAGLLWGVGLPAMWPPNCDPKFEWLSKVRFDHHKGLNKPILRQYARVVPLSRLPYIMTIIAGGGGLRSLKVLHANNAKDPTPPMRQLENNRIEYRAYHPVTIIQVETIADNINGVVLDDPTFECVKNGPQ